MSGARARAGGVVLAVLGAASICHAHPAGDPVPEPMNVTIDVKPLQPHKGTTLASCVHPLMAAAGRPEWSMARLQGVLGHAFQFAMEEGGGMVFHDNLDWSLAVGLLPELARFRVYEANDKSVDVDWPALKAEARDAAVASLERGIPVLVWQPMSLEQKESDHPAHHAYCWGLIVGYDPEGETYTVRHPFVEVDYMVRYDALGPGDPGGWFNVTVYQGPAEAAERATHLMALRNAVAFAEGTRFEQAGRPQTRPQGLAAYETWSAAFDSADVVKQPTRHHAKILTWRRELAAGYMRELTGLLPEGAEPLAAAAADYDREHKALVALSALVDSTHQRGEYTGDELAEARRLIAEALEADRAAVGRIEAALAILDGS